MQCATNYTIVRLNTRLAELEARAAETWTPERCAEEGGVAVTVLLLLQAGLVLGRVGKKQVGNLSQLSVTIHVVVWKRFQAWRAAGVVETAQQQAGQLVLASGVVTGWLQREAARCGQQELARTLEVSRTEEVSTWVMAGLYTFI